MLPMMTYLPRNLLVLLLIYGLPEEGFLRDDIEMPINYATM